MSDKKEERAVQTNFWNSSLDVATIVAPIFVLFFFFFSTNSASFSLCGGLCCAPHHTCLYPSLLYPSLLHPSLLYPSFPRPFYPLCSSGIPQSCCQFIILCKFKFKKKNQIGFFSKKSKKTMRKIKED